MSVLSSARPAGKLARWALTIQVLNLIIKHCAGKLNGNADALSRNPCEGQSPYSVDDLSVDVCFECPKVRVDRVLYLFMLVLDLKTMLLVLV